jgi:putative hydrolases of HD superfamily
MNRYNLEKIINFLLQVDELKRTYRYSTGVNMKGDSTADHSWRLSLMVILIIKELNLNIDELKAIKIALTHDLAEAITGDIDYILIKNGLASKKEKEAEERMVMENFKNSLPEELGQEIFNLWEEYEKAETPESAFVKILDKVEAQLYILPVVEQQSDVETILTYADPHLEKFPDLKPLVEIVKEKLYEEYKKHGIKYGE